MFPLACAPFIGYFRVREAGLSLLQLLGTTGDSAGRLLALDT